LNRKSLTHRSCQCDNTPTEGIVRSIIVALIISGDHPDQKNKIDNDTNDAVSHDACPKLEVFEYKNEDKKHNCVDYGIDNAELMRWNKSYPLSNDELEVEQVDENKIEPNAYIIKNFSPSAPIKMSKYCVVKIRLITHVQNTEIT